MLYGYGSIILDGALVTIEQALLSVALSFLLGLVGAAAKSSQSKSAKFLSGIYTTLIRGVPDLVLMLLIFYGLQLALNSVAETVGFSQINIDPFVAGVITIGFIYGAYFTETFRGAYLMVPKGQLEAGVAYGFSPWQTFRYILFPQLMRFALPGIANNWQVTLKATALVSIIGLSDVVKATQNAGKGTYHFFYFTIVAAVVYLIFTTVSNLVLLWLERRYSMGVRSAEL